MEQIAVLRDFDLDDCSFMSGGPDCRQLFEQITRSGLLMSSDGRGRHRFHHLLREAVLRQTSAVRRTANQKLAAQLHRSRGHIEEGIADAIASGEYEHAAADLERISADLIFAGR